MLLIVDASSGGNIKAYSVLLHMQCIPLVILWSIPDHALLSCLLRADMLLLNASGQSYACVNIANFVLCKRVCSWVVLTTYLQCCR